MFLKGEPPGNNKVTKTLGGLGVVEKVLRASPYVDQRQHSLGRETEARHRPSQVSPHPTTHVPAWTMTEERRTDRGRGGLG